MTALSSRERAPGRDGAAVKALIASRDVASWMVRLAREAWDTDHVEYAQKRYGLLSPAHVSSALLRALKIQPDLLVVEGNLLVNTGIQRLEDNMIGASANVFDNANSYIGVGDATTAATAADTDLGGAAGATHRFFRAMNATYPSRSGQVVTWQSDFPGTDAAFAWQEWGITRGATSASGDGFLTPTLLLNHKITSLGTKPGTSATWTLTATITIS